MIHQAKSNPQLLDEQIFSGRLESAISALGTFATRPISPRMLAGRGSPDVSGWRSGRREDPKRGALTVLLVGQSQRNAV
jgi:hypothetical protein